MSTEIVAAPATRQTHVEHCMGTVFSIDIRDPGDWHAPVAEAIAFLNHADAVFSTYRPVSDINRIARSELTVDDADPLVPEVLDLCIDMQRATDGWFSPMWDGRIDPTGLVKGWAIERVSLLLRSHGSHNHAVNGGGDVQLAGERSAGLPWRVGITDPCGRGRTLTSVIGRDFAVATSGVAERGAHIRNPFSGALVAAPAAVTVVGRTLTAVDCYATAAFAMGTGAADWLERLHGYEGLVVDVDGATTATSNLGRRW
jgi:thiamine biosynthesis lipoprotein